MTELRKLIARFRQDEKELAELIYARDGHDCADALEDLVNQYDRGLEPGIYQHYKGGYYRLLCTGVVASKRQRMGLPHWLAGNLSERPRSYGLLFLDADTGEIVMVPLHPDEHYPDGCPVVVYICLRTQHVWIRPAKMWTQHVDQDGEKVLRFAWVGDKLP